MKNSTFSKAIESEAEYRNTSITLAQKKRPPAVLRLLMNSFESYRQARKFGWSRPWNKTDLMNFQSFKLDTAAYPRFLKISRDLLQIEAKNMSENAYKYCTDLLNDKKLMAFIFVHEYTRDGKQFEGATLSLGRVNNKRFRDRIDIIVESLVVDGVSQGLERSRIFIDPYRENDKKPLWQGESKAEDNQYLTDLFSTLSHVSWLWAKDKNHIWDHWTSAYIDYFGERQWQMSKSYFFVEQSAQSRIETTLPADFILNSKTESLQTEIV